MGRYLGWLGRRVLAASRVTWLVALAGVAVVVLLATGVLTPSSSPPARVASSGGSHPASSPTTAVVATTQAPATTTTAPRSPTKKSHQSKRRGPSRPTSRTTILPGPPAPTVAVPSTSGLPRAFARVTLTSVATLSSTDGWVVGQPSAAGAWGMLRYDNSGWTPATVPGPAVTLDSVFALNPADVWAVGGGATVVHCTSPSSCTHFTLGSGAVELRSIWGYSPGSGVDFLWVVGQGGTIYALTWNGAALTAAAQGSAALSRAGLNGVWGMVVTSGTTTSTYVWAVGDHQGDEFDVLFGTAAHPAAAPGNTLTWQQAGPSCTCAADLSSISGAAQPAGLEALWAVGPASPYGWTILNFQGSTGRWTPVPGPSGPPQDLAAAFTPDAGQAWAAGAGGTILAFHGSWSRQPTPGPGVELRGVDGVGGGPGQIWTVGPSGTVWAYRPSAAGPAWKPVG